MDWFERLTGFAESSYKETQARLEVVGGELRSKLSGRCYAIGELELVSLHELRARVAERGGPAGALSFTNVSGDVRPMHRRPEYAGALFQVASQFNLLEMTGPGVTPEQGVTRYADDRTQGPACAQAAGAATIFRNYFAPVGDQVGQTADRQLDGLADLGAALADRLGRPVSSLWAMRNGYCLPNPDGLAAIDGLLRTLDEQARDQLRARLRIGVHRNIEVTDGDASPGPRVSQAFCSALPVAYCRTAGPWALFAELVLEAAYEATLLEASLNAGGGGSDIVLLTRLGGGAFGNDDAWIDRAITRALRRLEGVRLNVLLVSYGAVPAAMRALERSRSGD